MEANPVRIIEYFDGTKQSIIPLFQRPYTWEKAHWNALWNDIMAQYENEEDDEHFMGAIVSIPARTVPVGVTKHLVIDGQQRLTTMALLLCALRQRVDSRNQGRIDDFLTNRRYENPDRLKIVPTHGDRKAYAALMEGTQGDDEHPMVQATKF